MTTSSLVILVCCLLALDLATGQDLVQEIKSISYPEAYPNVNGGDAYGLSVTKKKQISFVFEQLDLKEKDSITIFRGPAVDGFCTGDKLIEYKGTKIGSTLAGFSSVDKDGKACVDVEYDHPTENDNTTINRFKLMTYAYEICGQGTVYTLSSMYLASHMYPSVYPSGQACNWKVRPDGSHSSQRIVVKLERVNVAKNHYLELGPINKKQVRYTSATSQVVTTDSNNLDIKFNTKDKQTPSGTGFLLSYTLIGCKSTEVPKKTNAAPQNTAKFYDANYKIQYKCNSGYEFRSEAAFEYAVCNGNTWKWENTAPNTECVRIECPSLGTLENGQISLTDKYFYKSVATFTCDAGATLHGVSKLTCNVDGEWSGSGTLPLCLTAEQTTCAPLIAPAHGHWTCQSIGMNDSKCLSHGSVQTLTCNTGFSVNSTNVLNRCNFTEWQNSNLHCERNCCPDVTSDVAAVAHLNFTADSFCYTHRVTYSCAVGYVLEGEAERECGPDGDWQPNATIPWCRAVDCGPPPSVDEQTRVSYDKTGYQDRAIYSCKDGERYMLVGPTTVSCGKDEKWSEVTGPSCVLRECYLYELQLSAPGAIVTPEKKQYYVGDVAAHICGNVTSVITCTARGWLGAVKSAKPCRSSVSRLGVYQSPDYPVPYNRPPQTLLRQFTARPEERIVFVINDLSINNDDVLSFAPGQVKGSICGEDIVKSYVGGDRSNIPISDVVMTPSERACSEFSIVREPSIDIVRTGFNIDVFGLHKCPEDRDAYTITEPAFYIASPNYPNLFETGYDCFWYIAPESCSAGQRVKVLVEYLSTAASSSEHCAHQLVIGPVKSSQKILCGEKEDEAIEVDGCVASVHFDARATTEHADQGFFLSYSVTGCSAESLPLKDKATLVNAAAYYPVGYTAVFRCDRGYWFRSGTQEEYAYCDASNYWEYRGTDSECSPIKCSKFTVERGSVRLSDDLNYGSVAEVSCMIGYKLVGSRTLSCGSTEAGAGVWSDAVPTCVSQSEAGRCSQQLVENGAMECNVFQTSCSIKCNEGYNAFYNGSWSCDKGELLPSRPTGNEVKDLLRCLPAVCGKLVLENKEVKYLASGTTFGSVAEFFCADGYVVIGTSMATCGASGQWRLAGFGEPECLPARCDVPPTSVEVDVAYADDSTFGAVARYSCGTDLRLVGSSEVSCGATGHWEGSIPYCVRPSCSAKEVLEILPANSTIVPFEAVLAPGQANVSCEGVNVTIPIPIFCSAKGWVLDNLYTSGCIERPNDDSASDLRPLLNSTSPGFPASYDRSVAFNYAVTVEASKKKNRVVLVTRYVKVGGGDELSLHLGAAGFSDPPRCSDAASQLLRSYKSGSGSGSGSGGEDESFGVVYAEESACVEFNVSGSGGSSGGGSGSGSGNLGYFIEAYELATCPSIFKPAVITEDEFVIVSPHYPRAYVTLESCAWSVKPHGCEGGKVADVLVEYVDTAASHKLRLIREDLTEQVLSGSKQNEVFNAGGCKFDVVFDASANALPGSGFRLKYKVSGCSESEMPKPDGGVMKKPSKQFGEAAMVEFVCPVGMKFTSGKEVEAVECSGGSWSTVDELSRCEYVQCAELPGTIENGQINFNRPDGDGSGANVYDTTVTFGCNGGYVLVGQSWIKCKADGEWSGGVAVCALPSEVYACSAPFAPQHGKAECSDTSSVTGGGSDKCLGHGAKWTVSCNEGYEVLNGASGSTSASEEIVCRNSSWVPGVTCKSKCCEAMESLVGGAANAATISDSTGNCFGDQVYFSCRTGYELKGAKEATCQSNQLWSARPPTCELVQCAVPFAPRPPLRVVVSSNTYNSTMSYWCDAGYTLVGESRRVCKADGKWSGSQPQCAANECGIEELERVIEGVDIHNREPPYYFGDKVKVSCKAGDSYQVEVRCGADGWETGALEAACVTTVVPTRTTPMVITTASVVYEVPRLLMNEFSPNYPGAYPSAKKTYAKTIGEGSMANERVVVYVKWANLRAGDSLKLFSQVALSGGSCADSTVLKEYTGSVSGSNNGGSEKDYVVASTSSACYLLSVGGQQSRDGAVQYADEDIGFELDVFSLEDCPRPGSGYALEPPSFALASPGYPSNYQRKLNCEWKVAPSCSSQKLRLQFDKFDVPCGHQVKVSNGSDASSSKSYSYCGDSKPPSSLVLDGCSATIGFNSDANVSPGRGFQMSYSLIGCAADQLPVRENKTYTRRDFYDVGAEVEYKCASGMRYPYGRSVERVRCNEKYEWEVLDEATACVLVECPDLASPENGYFVASHRFNYMSVAVFGCDVSYELVGVEALWCMADGTWNDTAPTCRATEVEVSGCGDAPILLNSEWKCVENCSPPTATKQTYADGAVLEASCKNGYEFNANTAASNRTTRCVGSSWVPSYLPDCTRYEFVIEKSEPDNGAVITLGIFVGLLSAALVLTVAYLIWSRKQVKIPSNIDETGVNNPVYLDSLSSSRDQKNVNGTSAGAAVSFSTLSNMYSNDDSQGL